MDQYLLIPFLGRWTSIYQLFWCSPGVQGLIHCHMRSICATALFDRMYNWTLWESEKQVWRDSEFSWILQRQSHWNILSMARIGKRSRHGRYDDMAFFSKIWGFFCIDPKWWQEVIFSNCWGDDTWVFLCDKQTTTRNHLWGSNPDRDQQPWWTL